MWNPLKKLAKNWQWYKDNFQIIYLKYLVFWFALVPLVHTFFKDALSIEAKKFSITLSFDLPFNWQMLWVSSLCFVVAFAIYWWKCPTFIRKYNSFGEYKNYRHSPRWIIWECEELVKMSIDMDTFVQRLKEKRYITEKVNPSGNLKLPNIAIEKDKTILGFLHNKDYLEISLPIVDAKGTENREETHIAEREIFWELFGRFSKSSECARIFISIFLMLSLLFFLIVIVQYIKSGLTIFIG